MSNTAPAEALALACTGTFFGAALYLTAVQHPATMQAYCSDEKAEGTEGVHPATEWFRAWFWDAAKVREGYNNNSIFISVGCWICSPMWALRTSRMRGPMGSMPCMHARLHMACSMRAGPV